MNKKFFVLEFDHKKLKSLKQNIIITESPDHFKTIAVDKYYNKMAKYSYNRINKFDPKTFNFVEKIPGQKWMLFKDRKINTYEILSSLLLNIFLNEFNKIKTLAIINLSYSHLQYSFFEKEMNFMKNIFKNVMKTKFKITTKHSPFFDTCTLHLNPQKIANIFLDKILLKKKQDFIFINTVFNPHVISSIMYYKEHIYSIQFITYLYYILLTQKIDGYYLIGYPSFEIKLSRDYIQILRNYYKKVYLFTYPFEGRNFTYLICKNFKGITNSQLKIFKNIYEKIAVNIYKQNIMKKVNIFDPILRKKNYVSKHFENFNSSEFIQNIIDIPEDKEFEKKINQYNKKVYSTILTDLDNFI